MSATAATMEFDPAVVVPEDVVGLTGPQCRKVLAHYQIPDPPKKWKVSDIRKLTLATVSGLLVDVQTTAPPPGVVDPIEADTVAEPDAPGTEVELHSRPNEVAVIPEASKWQQITSMAEYIHKSGLCPKALKKPEDVGVVLLAANDLGIPLTQAVDKIFVIDGKKGMMAELMVALIRRDGHNISPDQSNDATIAIAHCRRRDNGDSATIQFTIEEAIHAGLCSRDDKGNIISRKDGKKKPWELYTSDMLWARCVARAARRMFSDCLMGVSYIPDELGYIDADDNPAPRAGVHGEATVTVQEQRSAIAARIQELPEDLRKEVGAEWTRRNFPRIGQGKADLDSLSPAGCSQIGRFLEGLEARAAERVPAEPEVPDAEVVAEPDRCPVLDGELQCTLVEDHDGDHQWPDPDDVVADAEVVEDPEETIEQMRDRLAAEKGSGSEAVPGSGAAADVVAPDTGEFGTAGSSIEDEEYQCCSSGCEEPGRVEVDGRWWCAAHEPM